MTAFLVDGLQGFGSIESLSWVDGCPPDVEGSKTPHHHPKAMVKRHGKTDLSIAVETHDIGDLIRVIQDIVVR